MRDRRRDCSRRRRPIGGGRRARGAVVCSASACRVSTKKDIGAHQIFLGQIRADVLKGKTVQAIEFTTYPEMAEEEYYNMRENIFAKYKLSCMHVYHSLGRINAGEINLFVFTSSVHRKDAIDACNEIVEFIKTNLPVWGKEIFENEEYTWKENK